MMDVYSTTCELSVQSEHCLIGSERSSKDQATVQREPSESHFVSDSMRQPSGLVTRGQQWLVVGEPCRRGWVVLKFAAQLCNLGTRAVPPQLTSTRHSHEHCQLISSSQKLSTAGLAPTTRQYSLPVNRMQVKPPLQAIIPSSWPFILLRFLGEFEIVSMSDPGRKFTDSRRTVWLPMQNLSSLHVLCT